MPATTKPMILVAGKVLYAIEEQKELEKKYTFQPIDSKNREEFFADCKGRFSEAVALYNNSCPAIGPLNAELINALPASVKILSHHGAGYDPIDVHACTKRGIQLSNTPGAVDHGTATVAMFLIISALRNFWKAQLSLHAGQFKNGCSPAFQNDVEQKVLGIVGMGGIGRALVKRALGFDMKVIYHNRKEADPALLADFPAGAVVYCSTLDELLAQADVVSLHVPLNPHTEKLFGKAQFAKMKKGSAIVNTARGGVIDEEALLEALESGHLSSAGLDVFPNEPQVNPKLIANDRLTLLPHMGTETRESRRQMENTVLNNLVAGIEKGKVINVVPEQADMIKA
ncbi:BZ3500_MvSof-1268-A1-R1_Chr3-1g06115 [Microbotryum saponariae]|uniref:BZ3500_MvSof-1268-A1-R1_Chr3-1g06115 protein n=1 Tax=Microbotryum saponariae TaxID=289078 RepID=A0A2X0LG97_9BASI|nr:BZ3500_MvSof-1268-A1-R1_Chr3-1g06115 [Microbotryum saponariae]SDA03978.1 BZ3501_MvSof-1269-A2-R1_Chr3-2g05800 [Microbotryum saponariae]